MARKRGRSRATSARASGAMGRMRSRRRGVFYALGALLLAGLGAAVFGGVLRHQKQHAADSRPVHVLLISVDTLRADALGAYGNAKAQTPWMDRLAAGGARFETAHAHNVVTLPSHANLLSGRYPLAHGVRDNSGFRFPTGTPTLATLLKERGY